MRTDWRNFALAALVGALLVVAWPSERRAGAAGSTDSNPEMIAVTGEYGNGTTVLYVIDTKTRNLAVYRALNGTGVELIGARRIAHDLQLLTFNDRTRDGFSPLELEAKYERWRSGRGEAPGTPTPSTETPATEGDGAAPKPAKEEPAKEVK